MYRLIDFCCICFYNKEHLQQLSNFDGNNITYYTKLILCIPEMNVNQMNDQNLICKKCCETMDIVYKFRQKCLKSKTLITDYISLNKVNNISNSVNIYLADINKFDNVKTEDSHNYIKFVNIEIKLETESKNSEEYIGNSLVNPLGNRDENKIDVWPNDIISAPSDIKKESETIRENLQGNFDNILEMHNNDAMETKIEENHDYSVYSEKCSYISMKDLDECKIDILHNDIKLLKNGKNVQCENDNTEDFSKTDCVISAQNQDKDNTSECAPYSGFTTIKEKQNIISLSKKITKLQGCNTLSPEAPKIRRQMKIHTAEKTYECTICKQRFSQSGSVNAHMRIHTGEKPHECRVCRKKFSRSTQLNIHMRIHTGETPHQCSVCKKQFKYPTSLANHVRTHTGEKPYECGVCNRRFSVSSILNVHMRSHTGDRPYQCSVCMNRFTHLSTLNNHLKIHTKEKPYECRVCNKKFSRSFQLNNHVTFHT